MNNSTPALLLLYDRDLFVRLCNNQYGSLPIIIPIYDLIVVYNTYDTISVKQPGFTRIDW